jgi:hypothetical protein
MKGAREAITAKLLKPVMREKTLTHDGSIIAYKRCTGGKVEE